MGERNRRRAPRKTPANAVREILDAKEIQKKDREQESIRRKTEEQTNKEGTRRRGAEKKTIGRKSTRETEKGYGEEKRKLRAEASENQEVSREHAHHQTKRGLFGERRLLDIWRGREGGRLKEERKKQKAT